jgi:hypothetical protein
MRARAGNIPYLEIVVENKEDVSPGLNTAKAGAGPSPHCNVEQLFGSIDAGPQRIAWKNLTWSEWC